MPLRAVLRRTCGISTWRAVGFVHLLHESVPQASSGDPYLGGGDVHAATFQRGFAGRIGETHLHPGLKLRCCPDSDRGILPSAVVRFNRTAEVHKQKHTRHVHVRTRNLLPPEHITSPGSSAAFEQRRSALKPCHSANTWHPSGIIKTGHAPEPPSFTAPSYPPPHPPNAPWQQYPLRRRFFHFSCQSHLLHHLPGMALIENALKCWCGARTGCLHAD